MLLACFCSTNANDAVLLPLLCGRPQAIGVNDRAGDTSGGKVGKMRCPKNRATRIRKSGRDVRMRTNGHFSTWQY